MYSHKTWAHRRHWRCAVAAALRTSLLIASMTVAAPVIAAAAPSAAVQHPVHVLKITVLVTNVAGDPHAGDGEWGFSALVEVDGQKILYDTGASADLVVRSLKRETAVVAAVGSSFTLGKGIDPLALAR
jgi:hypothetical protein